MSSMGQEAAALSRGAEQVRLAQGDVTRLCQQLTGEMQQTRPHWQGGGGRAFHGLMEVWAERQQRIVGALEGLAASLDATERDNVGTDEHQAAAASGLAARLA